jgi:hypothetical protein
MQTVSGAVLAQVLDTLTGETLEETGDRETVKDIGGFEFKVRGAALGDKKFAGAFLLQKGPNGMDPFDFFTNDFPLRHAAYLKKQQDFAIRHFLCAEEEADADFFYRVGVETTEQAVSYPVELLQDSPYGPDASAEANQVRFLLQEGDSIDLVSEKHTAPNRAAQSGFVQDGLGPFAALLAVALQKSFSRIAEYDHSFADFIVAEYEKYEEEHPPTPLRHLDFGVESTAPVEHVNIELMFQRDGVFYSVGIVSTASSRSRFSGLGFREVGPFCGGTLTENGGKNERFVKDCVDEAFANIH